MTTERYHRCRQCGDEYLYQGSGPGCERPDNDAQWCPACKGVVNEALKAIPRKFEQRWMSVTDNAKFMAVTLEMVLDWEKKNEAENHSWPVRRIWPGLIDMTTGEAQEIRLVQGRDEFQGVGFRVSTWPTKPEYSIEVSMEYDLINQQYTGHRWL